jgi:type III pantothenate kinase
MLLAIDAGNTNVVFAVFDGDTQKGIWRCSTDPRRTADEYAAFVVPMMAAKGLQPSDVSACIVASVVPEANFNLRRLCIDYFGNAPLCVGSDIAELGIKVLTDKPSEVGADRLVNVLGATLLAKPPFIVIDFGTATTFDVANQDGNYCGGVIAPGINLSLEALHRAAAKLPRVEVEKPSKVIGTGTVGAIQSGLFWGYVGLIEGLIARIQAEYGAPMKVIATGGLGGLFQKHVPLIEQYDPDLTLKGLRLIHARRPKPLAHGL